MIDIHHHYIPPFYVAENRERIREYGGGYLNPAWLSWEPQKSLDAMNEHGVTSAILSLSTPGVWFGDLNEARRTARRCNDYAAALTNRHPNRFGFFAAVPLPDTAAALAEIAYALDDLKANGVGLLTSYGGDLGTKWLGDPAYDRVFEELDRRESIVFVHPTVPLCCRTLLPRVSPFVAEIPQDTARAITNLLFTGTFTRFPNIKFIFSHAGGNVPMLLGRMHDYPAPNMADVAPTGVEHELRRLYYDVAGTAYAPAIAALRELVPATQILFGSDAPYVPLRETARGVDHLSFSALELEDIGDNNASRLLTSRHWRRGLLAAHI